MTYDAVREAMADIYVALRMLKRRGGKRRRAGDARPLGLSGPELDATLDRWALKFPDQVH